MHDQLCFHVGSTSQSAAQIYFSLASGGNITAATGKCVGPFCKYAKTLPAEFLISQETHPNSLLSIAGTTVIDPCYWTPKLPFTYEVDLRVVDNTGQEIAYQGNIGILNWHQRQHSFYLDARRTVLRGHGCLNPNDRILMQSREQESTLLIEPADRQIYQLATNHGAGLVIDLRKVENTYQHLQLLDWFPPAMAAILTREQLNQLPKLHLPHQCLLTQCLTAESQLGDIAEKIPDALAIELEAAEKPSPWLSKIDLPLIAIRQGLADDQLQEPRQACDRLQAELSPESSLAGYFVSK